MVAITATSYATPSAQVQLSRAKLEQARREADQAESNAKVLRQEADQAEQDAQDGRAKVSNVSRQVAQTDSTYTSQVRQQAAANSSKQLASLRPPTASTTPSTPAPSSNINVSNKLWTASQNTTVNGQLVNQTA